MFVVAGDYGFGIERSARRTRGGHMLVELLVASVSGSMLLAALASTMYIAGRVAYSPLHAQHVLDGTNVALALMDELRHAIYIVDRGPTHIEFVTDDRNGDRVEDTFRYAWTGTAGDPLTKAFNRGTPIEIMESVASFGLEYVTSEQHEILAEAGDGPIGVTERRLRRVQVTLQCTESNLTRIDTAVPLKNEPVLAGGMAITDFDKDPTTQDRNGDGEGDFRYNGGASFTANTLMDGWWNGMGDLEAAFGDDSSLPLDVRFRGVATSPGEYGGTVELHIRLSASQKGLVRASIWLDSDGTLSVGVGSYNGSGWTVLEQVDGLPYEPVEVRLVADPSRQVWTYSVDGVTYGSLNFPAYSESLSQHKVRIYELGAEARFDYVRAVQPLGS